MKTFHAASLAIAGLAACVAPAQAASYRIYFKGSEALAVQSSGAPTAGYLGVPAAGGGVNLSAGCSSCVPGGTSDAFFGAGVPNQIVTFLHPYTNKAITVPLTLPTGRPKLITRRDRIIYDYGLFSYKVVVRFLENGEVQVKYRG